MTIDFWLEEATADARRRGLDALVPLLEGLAQSTRQLRAADWNADARGDAGPDRSRPPAGAAGPDESHPPAGAAGLDESHPPAGAAGAAR
jgi:hypothetical protein